MSWITMLERFTKTRTRCPIVVYGDKCGFLERKRPKKGQRKPKISRFLTFLSNFCQIFDRIRGLDC